ncbi:elongation factor G-binding protein, partial [Enterococcus faecium]
MDRRKDFKIMEQTMKPYQYFFIKREV